MKRFTLTPQPRKSIRVQPLPGAQPRLSVGSTDTKPQRNIRDKSHKLECAEEILKFLTENAYEGAITIKTLLNPSNKDFISIFKFIYSFIDATPFAKFEDDLMNIIRMLKYPYASEITRSQLQTVTPHSWPVLLNMIRWLTTLIMKIGNVEEEGTTVEKAFLEFVCEGYSAYMVGIEDDEPLERMFMEKVEMLDSNSRSIRDTLEQDIKILEEELQNINSNIVNLKKYEDKKKKLRDDLNALISHEKQLECKRVKYMENIERYAESIDRYEAAIGRLVEEKNQYLEQISKQSVNPEDIKEMNIEKMEYLKELERLKPFREKTTKALQELESRLSSQRRLNEECVESLREFKPDLNVDIEVEDPRQFNYTSVVILEDELAKKRESLINYEVGVSTAEEKLGDRRRVLKDLEIQQSQSNTKLQTIGAIYLEKKELSEKMQQKNRNEIDKLDNDLLKLKLESDSSYLKSEKDCSEAHIELDMQKSLISREMKEIEKVVWDMYNTGAQITGVLRGMEKETRDKLYSGN